MHKGRNISDATHLVQVEVEVPPDELHREEVALPEPAPAVEEDGAVRLVGAELEGERAAVAVVPRGEGLRKTVVLP